MTEVGYARRKNIWTKVPRRQAIARGEKIVKTRWIDINKGGTDNMLYRSRFLAKEFNNGEMDGLFAGTPPLEALGLLLSDAATTKKKGARSKVVMINDVSRVFFEAPMQRSMCAELPLEDLQEREKGMDLVGYLSQGLYGTRDAAANFQKEIQVHGWHWV